jgi:hypothetical protein
LHLKLPAGYGGVRPATGVARNVVVQGDFEITVDFEVLQQPEPEAAGPGTRFTLDIVLDKPGLNAATISRMVSKRGDEVSTWVGLQPDLAGKPQTKIQYHRAEARSGRLRLARHGNALFYHAAEGNDGDFVLLKRYPFETDDLKVIRLVGTTGADTAALEVRVTEMRIRAENLPGLSNPENGPMTSTWRLGLLAAVFVAVFVAVRLYARLRRRPGR